MASNEHSRQILERGYCVLESAWTDAEVDELRALILDRFAQQDPMPDKLWSTTDYEISPAVQVVYTGIVFYKLLEERPRIAELLLKPALVDALRGVLGERMTLEIVGGLVTDETRPFFAWHTHIGGYDDGELQSSDSWPKVDSADRITTLLYLDDIDDAGGVLLVYPREVGDPTAPPADPNTEPWPGQVEIRVPRGSVVAMEQCTWHTARPMTRTGLRVFLGCQFRAGHVAKPDWADDGLRASAHRSELLASVLPS